MEIRKELPYEEMQSIYNRYFSLGYLGTDINNKFALISLVCYITNKLKKKHPDWTHWRTLSEISKGYLPEDLLKGLAIICNDLSYGCTSFPTFGIADKDIPAKIKELLDKCLPF